MNIRIKVWFLLICLGGGTARGGEPIATFARETLGFDLAMVPFGKAVQTNGVYERTSPPLTTGDSELAKADFTWMTDAVAAKYNHDFTNRFVKYGFRDGKLAAVRISISAFGELGFQDGNAQELIGQRRKELVKIQNALRDASPNHHLSFDDASYHIQYGAMCAPIPESLFLMEIQITPVKPIKFSDFPPE